METKHMAAKVRNIFRVTITSILLFGVFAFGTLVYAANYGEGNYGSGLYGSGDTTAPAVSITAPSAGTVSGASVTVSATATDDVGVVGVRFVVDGSTTIGVEDTSPAYSVTWNTTGFSDGSHTITAVARDAAGNSTTSNGVVVTIDNTAPVRSTGSPSGTLSAGTTSTLISLTTNETATCKYSTSSGVAYGSMTNTFSTTNNTSHSTTVSGLSNGSSYTYNVRCTDARNNANNSDYAIAFTVNSPANVAPTANAGSDKAVTLPTSSTTLNGSGSDTDGTIASYSWIRVSGPITASITSPSSATTGITGMTTAGTYIFRLTVTDDDGATDIDDVSVVVSNAVDATTPTVSITAPSAGAVSGTSVTFSANATDNVGVIGVQFKVDGNNVGSEDTSSAYSVNWDTTSVSDGSHTLTAIARDAAGNTATSASVVVTVDNTAPVRSSLAPSGTLSAGTTSTSISLTTNEIATCRYSTNSGTAYGAMTNFNTTNSTSHSTTVSGLSNGSSYNYYVRCSDVRSNANGSSVDISFSINTPGNVAPTANAGNDSSVRLPTTSIVLSGSAADSDGTIASYLWSQVSGATATIASPSNATTSVTGMVTEGVYIFRLTVTDDDGATDIDDVSITINPAVSSGGGGGGGGGGGSSSSTTSTPQVNAGVDQIIILPTTVTTLYGSATVNSTVISSYKWKQTRGGDVVIASPTSAVTSVTGLTNAGTYIFELTATSSNDKSASDTVIITVQKAGEGIATTTIPGCTTSTGFSALTGERCTEGIVMTVPGCTSSTLFSPLTGDKCTEAVISTPGQNNSGQTSSFSFINNLLLGVRSEDVRNLQKYLNTHNSPIAIVGVGSIGNETDYFGPATKAALIRFQLSNNIVPASGFFGPLTRAFINSGSTTTTTTPVVPVTPVTPPIVTTPIVTTPITSTDRVYVSAVTSIVVRTSVPGGAVVGNVSRGITGTVLERIPSENGLSWLRVQFDTGVTGWTSSMYLTAVIQTQTVSTVTSVPVNLNVRVTPITGTILGTVPAGTTGVITGTVAAWTKVKFSTGLEGWVYSSLIK